MTFQPKTPNWNAKDIKKVREMASWGWTARQVAESLGGGIGLEAIRKRAFRAGIRFTGRRNICYSAVRRDKTLTAWQLPSAARMWLAGHDTSSIAEMLQVEPSVIANKIEQIKVEARLWRARAVA